MYQFRVIWTDVNTGEARAVDVSSLTQANQTAESLCTRRDTTRVHVAAFHPASFNELVVKFSEARS